MTSMIDACWQDLLDKDDRTSPADYPEMCLITRDELADYILSALSTSSARVVELEAALEQSEVALAVVRQSLKEQAKARLDPDMPLLVPEVLNRLRGEAEAAYALSEGAKDRIYSHGLSLLCDWQDRARTALHPEGSGEQ